MKDELRPIYSELKGLLFNAPSKGDIIYNEQKNIWEKFNLLVDQSKSISKDEYFETFRIVPTPSHGGGSHLYAQTYLSNLSGLVSRLHGSYFSDERDPLLPPDSSPKISQVNTQNVSQNIVIEFAMQLQTAANNAKTPEEKAFIEKIKDGLGTVDKFKDIILLIIRIASECKIPLERIGTLFGN